MITNEMLQVVAEYDGYKVVKQMPRAYGGGAPMYRLITFKRCMKYATSMDWLHPVAIKAYSELIDCKYNDISDIADKCTMINLAIMYKPINAQYIDLFNAVYEAIIFINQNKETCENHT